MSKIQKALGILSKDGHDPNAVGDPDSRAGSPSERKVRKRPRYLPENATTDEQLPLFSINIDLKELQQMGLQVVGDDIETVSQQFRQIKRPVLHTAFGDGVAESRNANVIMVTSALPKTGKTFCSFNLATSIARERDIGAVLVDADVLKPNISRVLGVDDRVGLIDYLLDESVTIDDILIGTDLHGIVAVPAGRQHEEATELLASRRMIEFVEQLSERFSARAIIVDTPPLLLTNEANVLAEHMGQIVMVVGAGESSQESVTEALGLLNRNKPINAILNKARGASFGSYEGDGYGYYSVPRKGRKYAESDEET
jgi:protein-tyrosine kinase